MSVVVVTRMQAADLLAVRAGMSLTGTVLEGLTTSEEVQRVIGFREKGAKP